MNGASGAGGRSTASEPELSNSDFESSGGESASEPAASESEDEPIRVRARPRQGGGGAVRDSKHACANGDSESSEEVGLD